MYFELFMCKPRYGLDSDVAAGYLIQSNYGWTQTLNTVSQVLLPV